MAQWIAHQTSNLGVAGSNPVENVLLFSFAFLSLLSLSFTYDGREHRNDVGDAPVSPL